MKTLPCRRPAVFRTGSITSGCSCSPVNAVGFRAGVMFSDASGEIVLRLSPDPPSGQPPSRGIFLKLSYILDAQSIFPEGNLIGEVATEWVENKRVGNRIFISYGNLDQSPVEYKQISRYLTNGQLLDLSVQQESSGSTAVAYLSIPSRMNSFVASFPCADSFWDEFGVKVQSFSIATSLGSAPEHGALSPTEPTYQYVYSRTANQDIGLLDISREYTQPYIRDFYPICPCGQFPGTFAQTSAVPSDSDTWISLRAGGPEDKLQLEYDAANKFPFSFHTSSPSTIMHAYPKVAGSLVITQSPFVTQKIPGGSVTVSASGNMPGMMRGQAEAEDPAVETDTRFDAQAPESDSTYFSISFAPDLMLAWYRYSDADYASGYITDDTIAAMERNLELVAQYYGSYLSSGTPLPWAVASFEPWWITYGLEAVTTGGNDAENDPNAQTLLAGSSHAVTRRKGIFYLTEGGETGTEDVGIDAGEFTQQQITTSAASEFTKGVLLAGQSIGFAYRTVEFTPQIKISSVTSTETETDSRTYARKISGGLIYKSLTFLGTTTTDYLIGIPWAFGAKESIWQEVGAEITYENSIDEDVSILEPDPETFGESEVAFDLASGGWKVAPA